MFNIAICDDEETLIGELKENLIKYAAETNKEFCFFIYHDGSVYFKGNLVLQVPFLPSKTLMFYQMTLKIKRIMQGVTLLVIAVIFG